ncbi:hypothetical protein U9K52_09870 [Chryseobacterium sp. MHB01]|uniref:hypothetical protein n=1 Tax=Chryseobacterium sp. MHB01 TaxID=3109433 RepID=UPI002AFE5E72|nr:hypothetical protein [Chryseobacterium sp. MHB01]MEA1849219.1 hypothetical protein [Chryseobacterium sp. MHB01]
MTPKDKAKDLFVKHLELIPDSLIQNNEDAGMLARLNAMVTVDELIGESSDKRITIRFPKCNLTDAEYFIQVKQELLNLK